MGNNRESICYYSSHTILSSAKNYFSLSVLQRNARNVIIHCSLMDISKSRPINDAALVTCHSLISCLLTGLLVQCN